MINEFSSLLLNATSVDETVWVVAKHVISKLGYVDCIIYLLDPESGLLTQKAAFGPKNPIAQSIIDPIVLKVGEGITGAVAASGKAELIPDTSKDPRYIIDDSIRLSEICVPIISHNEVIGVIDSEHPEKNFFSEDDLEILKMIASMVAVKLEQARAQEEIKQHKDFLEMRVNESTQELKDTIEKLKASNQQILQSSLEKETLMKEIHHRVKNNLQIVSSLLSLHSNKSIHPEEQAVFRDCQHRIKSMSIIHEQLYRKGNLAQINTKKYIEEISYELLESFDASASIQLNLSLDEVFLNIQSSVPFGLILNELFVNALKHAFSDGKGSIFIVLEDNDADVKLEITDNGRGFNTDAKSDTMGLDLIETLVAQIDGTAHLTTNENGTSWKITFPLIK